MTTELGSNLPPEVIAFSQESAEVIGDLQELARSIPNLSINLPFQHLPERVRQLLILAGIRQEDNAQIGYYYNGDPDEIGVSLHGKYGGCAFRFNWFPRHPNHIAELTIGPRLRELGDHTDYPHSLIDIQPRLSGGGYGRSDEDTGLRWKTLQTVVPDGALGTYHLQLLRDLTSFTKNCADILAGNILKPES